MMTMFDDLVNGLDDLMSSELERLGDAFSVVAQVPIPQAQRAADWACWWLWRVVSELTDRRGKPRLPEPPHQDVLSIAELNVVRDKFAQLASDADDDEQVMLAIWCRRLVAYLDTTIFDFEVENDRDNRSDLERWIAERRRERPIVRRVGDQPGDVDGIAPWREASED